jgi:ATP-dependent protease La (LON) substrate-binding domain
MQPGLLPLFPLQVVLLPGAELPLHIFEDRYKEMIGEAIRDRMEFGVILASEKGIVNTGCTAMIDKVLHEYPDGKNVRFCEDLLSFLMTKKSRPSRPIFASAPLTDIMRFQRKRLIWISRS